MLSHASILLLDDSPGECELFRQALQRTKIDVALYTQHDAEAAFHFLEDRTHHSSLPQLILLDLQLRGQHGRDVLKRLRADVRFKHIPVVIFTTSDDSSDIVACYSEGANAYVVKPGTFEELARCTERLCRFWIEVNVTLARETSVC